MTRIQITVEEAPRLHFALNVPSQPRMSDDAPDCIEGDAGEILAKVSKYADGRYEHYRYRRAVVFDFDWVTEIEQAEAEEAPLDTPSLDTSFHDHEMDVS